MLTFHILFHLFIIFPRMTTKLIQLVNDKKKVWTGWWRPQVAGSGLELEERIEHWQEKVHDVEKQNESPPSKLLSADQQLQIPGHRPYPSSCAQSSNSSALRKVSEAAVMPEHTRKGVIHIYYKQWFIPVSLIIHYSKSILFFVDQWVIIVPVGRKIILSPCSCIYL